MARDTRLFHMLEKIVAEQKEMKRILTSISAKLNQTVEHTEGIEEIFPIPSQEKLEELEDKLSDKDFSSSVVRVYIFCYKSMACEASIKQ